MSGASLCLARNLPLPRSCRLRLTAPSRPCPGKAPAAELRRRWLLEFRSEEAKGFSFQLPLLEIPEACEPVLCAGDLSGTATGTELCISAVMALLCVDPSLSSRSILNLYTFL